MKYLVLIPDGMADERVAALGDRTPMEAAQKPCMDALAARSAVGLVSNVPTGMVPESDTANMAILSFDPKVYSRGRSPLEAISMGLEMAPDETAYRCNVVTLSEDEDYDHKIMLDHSADEITTAEADELIKALEEHFGNDMRHFYTGVSYRHCILWKDGNDTYDFSRPHDIIGRCIADYLPKAENGGEEFYRLMKESYEILNHHPVNEARRARGLKPANSAWLWSPGKKPRLPDFTEKWGISGTVISAVDLIKGIGLCAGMRSIDVEGATGNVHTNYDGKAQAAIEALRDGAELVYIHVEAPDECGHRAEIENKVRSIELIDERILKPVYEYLCESGEAFKVMVLPDHPTPLRIRTHSSDPVPFFIFDSRRDIAGVESFTEATAATTGLYVPDGFTLLDRVIERESGTPGGSDDTPASESDSEDDPAKPATPATEPTTPTEQTEEAPSSETDEKGKKKAKKESFTASVFDYVEIVVLSVAVVLVIFTLFGRLCQVDGSSMRNTLHHGEMLIATTLIEPEVGDIVVFHQTSDTNERYNEPLVKRIIATEGQKVRIDYEAGTVAVDGKILDEPYIILLGQSGEEVGKWLQAPGHHFDYVSGIFEATVPEGCYFVMGDNRNNSADSRSSEIGFVDARRVLGKVVLRTRPYTVFD